MIDAFRDHFATDWASMTLVDWFGAVVAISLTVLMFVLYFYVFTPGNKDKLESHRDFVLKDDLTDGEK